MRPDRVRTWGDWFWEMFMRGGLFSLRRLPKNQAEQREEANRAIVPRDITKLNLDTNPSRLDSVQ